MGEGFGFGRDLETNLKSEIRNFDFIIKHNLRESAKSAGNNYAFHSPTDSTTDLVGTGRFTLIIFAMQTTLPPLNY
jgi:hypothetical protein